MNVTRSWAAPQCTDILLSKSQILNPGRELTELQNADIRMNNWIRSASPDELTKENLEERMKDISHYLIKYFQAAKISFTLDETTMPKGKHESKDIPEFKYNAFIVKGSAQGDINSRLLFAVGEQNLHPERTVTVIVDPLFYLRGDASGAYFGQSKTIVVGYDTFARRFGGLNDTLRHEIQHHFEELKIDQGKFTLARITLQNVFGTAEFPYAKYLRMDEIETHLRDIRFSKNHLGRNDNYIRKNLSEDPVNSVNNRREMNLTMRQYKIDLLKKMLTNSKEALQNIKSLIIENKPAFINENASYDFVSFNDSISSKYTLMNFKVAKALSGTNESLTNRLLNLVSQAEERIASVENELSHLADIDSSTP